MSAAFEVLSAGPGLTVQDLGRSGFLAFGVARGGAADRLAIAEGAALLDQSRDLAALEMAGFGGSFRALGDLRIALTGAPMRATLDGAPLVWNASHAVLAGQTLSIGAATVGSYGYLHLGGGIDAPVMLGARATHLAARLGRALAAGDRLAALPDPGGPVGRVLETDDRFAGGEARLVESLQTGLFSEAERTRFVETAFRRDMRGNRMGARLDHAGAGFALEGGRTIVSEIVSPGDIQITGDGTPFVLLVECQTTGGYPRIGTVIPADVPRLAQAAPGAPLRFRFVSLEQGVEAHLAFMRDQKDLPRRVRPLVRDPHDIPDLLSYQLISGATAGAPDAT